MTTDTPATGGKKKKSTTPSPTPVPASARVTSSEAAALLAAVRNMAEGKYDVRVDLSGLSAESAQLAVAINDLMTRVQEDLAESNYRRERIQHVVDNAIGGLMVVVRQGELSAFNTSTDDPVLAPLLDGFGKVIETLRTFVREINEAALRLSSSANEVLAASTQHESSSTEQAAAIHETTATMEELKHASAQIAENAGSVARVAEETLNSARSGRGAIAEFIQAMQQIRADGIAVSESITKLLRRVERIGTVVEVIDEIADRSDLLALNAALEGSRAGEAGKGFSIVAAEMRRLAENVLDSTKEIKNLISEIREATTAAAGAAEASRTATEAGERLGSVAATAVEGILAGVQETSDAARVINLATQQQRTATEQVVASMAEIEDVTRQTTQASKQATSAAAELTQLATRLSELIKRFKAD